MDLTEFKTHRHGASYLLPVYEVEFGRGLIHIEDKMLDFVKGSKDNPAIFRQPGFVTEELLAVCKQYLVDVNVGDLEDPDTQDAIVYIEEALKALQRRADKRKAAGVQGTYKPVPNEPGATTNTDGQPVQPTDTEGEGSDQQ